MNNYTSNIHDVSFNLNGQVSLSFAKIHEVSGGFCPFRDGTILGVIGEHLRTNAGMKRIAQIDEMKQNMSEVILIKETKIKK